MTITGGAAVNKSCGDVGILPIMLLAPILCPKDTSTGPKETGARPPLAAKPEGAEPARSPASRRIWTRNG